MADERSDVLNNGSIPPAPETDDSEIKQKDLRMANILTLSQLSFNMEEKREQSLISQSNSMLTALSIYSVALFYLIPILIDRAHIPNDRGLTCALIVFLPIVPSLILVILAQWRFKYQTMQTADQFRQDAENHKDKYEHQYQYDYQIFNQLTLVQKSKISINNKRLNLIRASMVLFLTSCFLLIFTGTILFCLYA